MAQFNLTLKIMRIDKMRNSITQIERKVELHVVNIAIIMTHAGLRSWAWTHLLLIVSR